MSDPSRQIQDHLAALSVCDRCPAMHKPVVLGRPVVSGVMLVGQAPGDKEPKLGRPFAWTAGRTLFRWFEESTGVDEERFRNSIYMAAVCRCFPGKNPKGGDRVPSKEEIRQCRHWLEREIELLRPRLILPVGKLAILQFMDCVKLDEVIGRSWRQAVAGHAFDLIPLPHPSGASTWHHREPGKTLLRNALDLVAAHPAFLASASRSPVRA